VLTRPVAQVTMPAVNAEIQGLLPYLVIAIKRDFIATIAKIAARYLKAATDVTGDM
jgi:hypothetical protein